MDKKGETMTLTSWTTYSLEISVYAKYWGSTITYQDTLVWTHFMDCKVGDVCLSGSHVHTLLSSLG